MIGWFCRPECGLQRIDHIVGNQPDLEMNNVVDWFVYHFNSGVIQISVITLLVE